MSTSDPLVSILTPIYNGEKYVAQCIESVLRQTYPHWEYILVNNCSTDKSLDIIQSYARTDSRLVVYTNGHFVGAIENHNNAFRLIAPESKYCKVVSADDWLYPECISRFVELAEHNPSVGIVGSYAITNDGVRSLGLPHDVTIFSGHDICRLYLRGVVDAFGTPSTVLYRSDLVRAHVPFYPGSAPSADLAICLECLRTCDFGFVQQILSFQRLHAEAASARLEDLDGFLLDRIEFLAKYGPIFLPEAERRSRMAQLLDEYYSHLAIAVVNLRDSHYWDFHNNRLKRLGHSLLCSRLVSAVLWKSLDLIFNPKQTIEKVIRRFHRRRAVPVDSGPA